MHVVPVAVQHAIMPPPISPSSPKGASTTRSPDGVPSRSVSVAMASSIGSPNETSPSPSFWSTNPGSTGGSGVASEVEVLGAMSVVVDEVNAVVESATVVVVAIDVVGARVVTVETDCEAVAVVSLVSVEAEVQPSKTTATATTAATRTTLGPSATPTQGLPRPITGIRHHLYNIDNPHHPSKRQTA